MATRTLALFLLFYCNFINGEDLTLGSNCQRKVECEQTLPFNSCNENLSGQIFSPEYPNLVSSTGTYKLRIISCPDTTIQLSMTSDDFKLGVDMNNEFKVGDGTDFTSSAGLTLTSDKDDDNCFPGNTPSLNYTSKGNELWIQADLRDGNCKFSVKYTIVNINREVYNFTNLSGNFSSSVYPAADREVQYIIDVSGNNSYTDLLFTVHEFDLNGIRGDYLKVAQGVNVKDQKDAAVFSWKLPSGYQILVEGPQANLVFNFFTPREGDTSTHSGYSISYQAIEKNLTTPSPTTTPAPTSPTPLPFKPDILGTELVFLDFVSNTTACENLVTVLNDYAQSSNMLSEGEIVPELNETVIEFTKVKECYHGWNVDLAACVSATVIVKAYYMKTDSNSLEYAFPRETVEEAVRQYGSPQGIVLPNSLIDVYWISVGAAVGIIAIILILLLIAWREKIRREYNRRKEYIRGSGSSLGPGDGFSKPMDSNVMGYVNNSFVYDEDDIQFGGITYDPDKLKQYNHSNSKHYGTTNAAPHSQSVKQKSVKVQDPRPLSPQRSNSLKWKPESPKSSYENYRNASVVQQPHQRNASIRGILKSNLSPAESTSVDVPSIVTLIDEPDDDILFDTHSSQQQTQQATPQPPILLQPVPVHGGMNSQGFEPQDLRSVTLDGYDSDDFGETNL